MGYAADVAEFAEDHGIRDFTLAVEMYNDPGPGFSPSAEHSDGADADNEPDRYGRPRGHAQARSRSRTRRQCRHWLRGHCRFGAACLFSHSDNRSRRVLRASSRSVQADRDSQMGCRIEKTAAVMRQCTLQGKTMIEFQAACEIVGITDDPLTIAESGEGVFQTVFERLDAEAMRQNASSDELIRRKLVKRYRSS